MLVAQRTQVGSGSLPDGATDAEQSAPVELSPAKPPKRNKRKLILELCERIAEGETVTAVCSDLGIAKRDVWNWTEASKDLRARYARARELQAHAVAEQAMLAAHGIDDFAKAVEIVLAHEEERLENMSPKAAAAHRSFINSLQHASVQRDKLRVDTLKWTAGKLAPRHYGERQQIEHSAKDNAPIPFTFTIDSPKSERDS